MKSKKVFRFLSAILVSLIFVSCGTSEEKMYEKSVEVFNAWNDYRNVRTFQNCKNYKDLIENYDFEDFEFYPEILVKVRIIQSDILFYCNEILEIYSNNEFLDEPQTRRIENLINEINVLMIAYLRNQNYILGESQKKFTTFYSFLIVLILIGLVILILLNEKELRKKNARISQSELMLKHTMEVQEAERSRISRELHDTVAQSMRYVSLLAEKIGDSELSEKIINAQNTNIEDIRKLCYNLTPPNFTNTDIIDSLNILANKIFDGTETQVRIVTNGEIDFKRFSEEQFINIYRIIQEIFQNANKYANANEVTVLFRQENKLKIIISDDGKGMDEKLVSEINNKSISLYQNLHFGLKNILERIQLLNGTIEYRSDEDCGTTIVIEV